MKKITFNSYFFSILIVSVLYFILPIIFSVSGDLPTAGSYIRSWLCFFTLTIASTILLLGKKYVRFYIVAFIILTLLGLSHYLWLVDPNYFQGNGGPVESFWGEYLAVYDNVNKAILDRRSYGVLYFDKDSWYVTHPEIWQIISWPFTFLQNPWLTYSPLNVFASLLASSNVVLLFNHKYPGEDGKNKSARKLVLYTTALYPMWLLNDTYWRDPMGVALISIGLSLVTLSDNTIKKTVSSVIFAFFSYIQRTIYIIIAGFSLSGSELFGKKRGANIAVGALFLILLYFFIQFYDSNVDSSYTSGAINYASTLIMPLKIVLGLIGPFPWTQFMLAFEGNMLVAYQPSDYLMGVVQFAYLICIVNNFKRVSFKDIDYSTMMGFGMMVSGLMTSAMHIGYIAEGVFFTLPWFYIQIGRAFKKYLLISLCILLLLNLLVILLGNFGFAQLWK